MGLPPFSVFEYEKDHIINLIRQKTGWGHRSEISSKDQLQYLFKYVESDHISAKTIVIENEYIEKNYLEDYSEYYARCFNQHPRPCSRIHFFSVPFTEEGFISIIESSKTSKHSQLKRSYLGFIVIRPIPNTFLAKVCLTPYKELRRKPYKILKNPYRVSLFGVDLLVETIAFQEQDKVVAACATSAIWMFLHASTDIHNGKLPSPSSITKSANPFNSEGMRTFPNSGLSTGQMTRSLKYFGIEPSLYPYAKKGMENLNEILELIYAYVSNDIPVLLGGKVYKKNGDQIEELGEHIVCVLGYKMRQKYKQTSGSSLTFKAHSIEKLYVHDDRYGPYMRIENKPVIWEGNNKLQNEQRKGLVLSNYEGIENLFSPDLVIIGLYHKVRISYIEISSICKIFHIVLNTYCSSTTIKMQRLDSFFQSLSKSQWEISLTTITKLKKNIAKINDWHSSSFGGKKRFLLEAHLPKYIWRCRILNKNKCVTEIYFDATEVPQGNLIIGFTSFSIEASLFWQFLSNEIKKNLWDKIYDNADEKQKSSIGCFIRYFSSPDKDITLDTFYGPTRLPHRPLKRGEYDKYNNISLRPDIITIRRDRKTSIKALKLDTKEKYIWVINKFGDFVLGKDIEEQQHYQGHPTLVDGEPARLGGELAYNSREKVWVINSKSRTYSPALTNSDETRTQYLNNVLKHNFTDIIKIE